MNELEDKLNALLNDPKQMERFTDFARSVMGGMAPPEESKEPDIDMGMLRRLGSLLSGSGEKNSREQRLLEAMKPYLSDKRRDKMDKAMKIARLASVAELAVGEFGGEGDV